ncbi:hypothetical protein F2Q70_00019110 [Brassica cretica]|uniref:Uncharacterized protein n=1 Tax=Brassica cretica TaxID=69181 RepID=A0A3N6SDQ9_BRACR|nr:hypothetical protein F2Q70_00019110 [Brassica cretica]
MCSSSPLLTTDCLVGALRFGVKTRRCCVPGRGGFGSFAQVAVFRAMEALSAPSSSF